MIEWMKVELNDSFWLSVHILLLLITICFTLGLLLNNYSVVDRVWSLVPIGWTWQFTLCSPHGFCPYLFILAILVTCWGTRLTYNFYRKGGYSWKEEDYRWAIVK